MRWRKREKSGGWKKNKVKLPKTQSYQRSAATPEERETSTMKWLVPLIIIIILIIFGAWFCTHHPEPPPAPKPPVNANANTVSNTNAAANANLAANSAANSAVNSAGADNTNKPANANAPR
jgi:uncharacterized membrane protein